MENMLLLPKEYLDAKLFTRYLIDERVILDDKIQELVISYLKILDNQYSDISTKEKIFEQLKQCYSKYTWFNKIAASFTMASLLTFLQGQDLNAMEYIPDTYKSNFENMTASYMVGKLDQNEINDEKNSPFLNTVSLHMISNKSQKNQVTSNVILDDELVNELISDEKILTVIDKGVQNWEEIYDSIVKGEVLVLNNRTEPLTQIIRKLKELGQVDVLNVVSHGDDGKIILSDSIIDKEYLNSHSEEFTELGKYLSKDGDIQLFGCNIAYSDEGKSFIQDIAKVTDAGVAGSINLTGNFEKNGDWNLEYFTEDKIDNLAAFNIKEIMNYTDILNTTYNFDSGYPSFSVYNIAGGPVSGSRTYSDLKVTIYSDAYWVSTLATSSSNIVIDSDGSGPNKVVYLSGGGVGSAGDPRSLQFEKSDGSTFNPISVKIGIWTYHTNTGQPPYSDTFTVTGYNSSGTEVAKLVFTPVYRDDYINLDFQNPSFSNYVDNNGFYHNQALTTNTGSFADVAKIKFKIGANTIYLDDLVISTAPTNNVPTISTASSGQTVNDTSTITPFSGITLADADGDNISLTITLDNNAKGTITGTGLSGTGPYTISSDSIANVQAKLRALNFNPTDNRVAPGSTETTTFSLVANDGTSNSSTNSTTTVISTSINDAPTDILLSSTSVNQSSGANATVGTLSDTDADTGDTATFTLVSGTGDTNNGIFNISATSLRANDSSTLSAGTYSIRVQVSDGDATYEKSFTITVVDDVNPTVSTYSPTTGSSGVALSSDLVLTFDENVTKGTGNIYIKAYSNDAILQTIDVTTSAVTVNNNQVTISHSSNFAVNTQYYVTIDATALDDNTGNGFTGISNKDTWKFTSVSDINPPTISSVSIPNSSMKVGDTVTATITVNSDSDDYTTGSGGISGTIGGFTLGSLSKTNNTTYTATFTITEGGTNVAAGSNIPVSFTLTDSSGNTSSSFTTAISQASDSIDANSPTVTDANISISGASGTGGAYKIGDTVTATWNNTSGGDNNSDISGVTVDFSAFGGGSSVAASNSSGTWTATYTITSGSLDVTNYNITVTATDNAGNSKTTADTTNATVDNAAPIVTDANISISGASGTGGAYKIGDTVTATWNNTAGGDNNSDTISGVTVDFSVFGGGSSVAASNSSGTWTATYTILSGSIDLPNYNIAVTATDNAGNSTTTADTTNATVDNAAPTVTDANISISGASGTGGAYKIGDTITATWDNTGSGENNSDTISGVTVNFSAFGGGSSVSASNSSGIWTATYTIILGSIDGTNKNVSVTASDNAGNTTTTSDTTNATVDNIVPTVSSISVPANATYALGQNLDFTVNTSENVTVNTLGGTPQIAITIGSTTKYATYLSGSGTTALVFRYTVESGLSDSDGIAIGSLSANSGTLKDAVGNDLTTTLNSIGSTTLVLVDAITPTVTITSAKNNVINAEDITISFTLSEDSSDFSDADISVNGGALNNFAQDNTNSKLYTATLSVDTTTTTAVTIDVNATTFTDAAGNDNSAATQKSLTVLPSVLTYTPADNSTSAALANSLKLEFSEVVVKGTGNIVIYKTSDNSVVETIDVTSNKVSIQTPTIENALTNTLVTIAKDTKLNILTAYYVQIDVTAFKDINNNFYAGINDTTTWNFTTADNQAPVITSNSGNASATISVDENQTSVIDIDATDVNVGQTLTYSLEGTDATSFDINASTGVITFKTAPNYENKNSYSVSVKVSDDSSISLSDTQALTININDVDEAPIITTTFADQIQDEDGKGLVVDLDTSDVDNNLNITPATYSVTSSNESIATAYILNGQVIVVPKTNANGTVTITVTTTVNGLSSSKSFTYTLSSVNDAPTISSIDDISHEQSSSQINKTITFDIWDDVDVISLSASISNENLIANSDITVSKLSSTQGELTYKISANNSGATIITVTAKDIENLEYKESFTVNVKASNDSLCVENAKTALVFDLIKQTNISQDALTSNLNLINSIPSVCDATISWATTDSSIVDTTGIVTQATEDKTIMLTANIVKGEFSAEKSFLVTVLSNSISDASALEKITFETIKEENEARYQITSKLYLPTTMLGKSITWTSSDDSVISPYSGYVTRASTDKTVTLTATIGSETKTFELKVLKEETSDLDSVTKDAQLLTINSLLGENSDKNSIIYNLAKPLPIIGANGSTISWSSSNKAFITNEGDVLRDSNADKYVILTATITKGSEIITKEFNFKVLQNKIETVSSNTFKNAGTTTTGTQVTTTSNGQDSQTTSTFADTILGIVDTIVSQDSVKSIVEFVDKVVNLYLNTDGSTQSTLQTTTGSSSLENDDIGSSTQVDDNGKVTSSSNTSSGSVRLYLNIDGTVSHEVINPSIGKTTSVNSSISNSSVKNDSSGNVETTSEVKDSGYLYKAVVTTNTEGETTTRFVRVDLSTGEESEIQNTLKSSTPYEAGNEVEISKINGNLYIKTTTPLNSGITVE